MTHTIAIIHTTTVTVEPLKALASELIPGCDVINMLDDSILPQLRRNGGDLRAVEDRLIHYARFAEQAGAGAILNACSSVGELVGAMQQHVAIPIVRIDEAMAEEAVRRGTIIGVAATLATTLNPTLRLIEQKAQEAAKHVATRSLLADSAFQKLAAGDRDAHDAELATALSELAASVDVVVLAQASMARVLPQLSESARDRCLSSPRLGMERLREALARTHAR
jgi:aspartate/glutamate racemase